MNRLSRILVELALEEDLRDRGDLTSRFFIDPTHDSKGLIVSREACVISGLLVAHHVCEAVGGSNLALRAIRSDGDEIQAGAVIGEISGPTQLVLQAERTLLNFMQRLTGVATVTRSYVRMISHTKAKLLDTRKTTPGWRELEKAAVIHGGGVNHRQGLYDGVIVKDNHLVANSDPKLLAKQISELRKFAPEAMIEFEADRLDQVTTFLTIPGIDRLLLDNMGPEKLRDAVALRDQLNPKILLEASGGITRDTIIGIAESGIDFISVGALTHSVRSIDLGLDFEHQPDVTSDSRS